MANISETVCPPPGSIADADVASLLVCQADIVRASYLLKYSIQIDLLRSSIFLSRSGRHSLQHACKLKLSSRDSCVIEESLLLQVDPITAIEKWVIHSHLRPAKKLHGEHFTDTSQRVLSNQRFDRAQHNDQSLFNCAQTHL